jgi:transcriptional regulator with XRE-family HTH domain
VDGEPVSVTIAKNLALARMAKGLTQDELAGRSGVSRATINQIESGESDPRLSTVAQLAASLETTPLLLLLGSRELGAILKLAHDPKLVSKAADAFPPETAEEMSRLLETGITRAQKRATELAASKSGGVARASGGAAGSVAAGAAIGTLLFPGVGTAVGAALGSLLSRRARR